jgi:DNA repair exonuclease SbcCD ATPase subunit
MPEIVSPDRIKEKLREFDERLNGALAATEGIVKLKNDAAKFVESIQETQEKSTGLQHDLQQIQEEWVDLLENLSEAHEYTEEAGKKLLERVDQECKILESRFSEASQKLDQENKDSRTEHSRLVETSRTHSEDSAKNSNAVIGLVSQTEQLLASIQEDLHATINDKLTQLDILMETRLDTIENERRDQVDKLKHSLEETMASFRQEVKKDLTVHQQGVDRQLTEFLGKQNMLIQNLAQQIDGFQRANQALASEQQMLSKKISIQEGALNKIPEQEAATVNLQEGIQALDTRLGQVVTNLKGLPFVGSSFKGV